MDLANGIEVIKVRLVLLSASSTEILIIYAVEIHGLERAFERVLGFHVTESAFTSSMSPRTECDIK